MTTTRNEINPTTIIDAAARAAVRGLLGTLGSAEEVAEWGAWAPTATDYDSCAADLRRAGVDVEMYDPEWRAAFRHGFNEWLLAEVATLRYVVRGNVRGDCGHRHRTLTGATKCLERDHRGCQAQGGYSDRRVRIEMQEVAS